MFGAPRASDVSGTARKILKYLRHEVHQTLRCSQNSENTEILRSLAVKNA